MILHMTSREKDSLFAQLTAMPDLLEAAFADISAQEATTRGADDTFAPVEQCWHLADLEREAVAVRIRRLRSEAAPVLPDFDGARAAEERRYRTLSLAEGVAAFRKARLAVLEELRALGPEDWKRTGTLEGTGPIALADIPVMMAEHDANHRREIEAWMQARKKGSGAR